MRGCKLCWRSARGNPPCFATRSCCNSTSCRLACWTWCSRPLSRCAQRSSAVVHLSALVLDFQRGGAEAEAAAEVKLLGSSGELLWLGGEG